MLDQIIAGVNEIIALDCAVWCRVTNGRPFTTLELSLLPEVAAIPERRSHGFTAGWRRMDQLIQKWRRKGWISFVRSGRSVEWSMTDAGRAAIGSDWNA